MKQRLTKPLHYASGYTLDLYCDHHNDDHGFNAGPTTYFGETFAECAKQARKEGWVLHKDQTATCPKCTGRKYHAV